MTSLRDMGYSTEAAVADLVDNSIDAGARHVEVITRFAGEASSIMIRDDGEGMTPTRLDEAMRYGSRREYAKGDLGRFGLGLKTASLSQCRRLTVATRCAPERARIHARRWDLDHVSRRDAWELLAVRPNECPVGVLEALGECPGTVVVWEALDRVTGYRHPDGRASERGFAAVVEGIRTHLGMVFHRFLAGDTARPIPLRIDVDGAPVEAWDPFARAESATRRLALQRLALDNVVVPVQPFILPSQPRFSSPGAHAAAAGPRRWNRQQGFYVYLRDRLIQSGGWSRLRAEDEHTKLARIAMDIPPGAEEHFGINVSKMRVSLPEPLRAELRALASGVAARARDAYDAHPSASHRGVNGLVEEDADYLVVSDDRLTVERVATVLVSELQHQPVVLRRILSRLGLDLLHERPPDTVDVVAGSTG